MDQMWLDYFPRGNRDSIINFSNIGFEIRFDSKFKMCMTLGVCVCVCVCVCVNDTINIFINGYIGDDQSFYYK